VNQIVTTVRPGYPVNRAINASVPDASAAGAAQAVATPDATKGKD